ncbi:hypothetical protein VB735_29975 [Halotia wernerae UHCC 0503]|nr:hypothetical protein [Halotia wernerae UHCC 0503]
MKHLKNQKITTDSGTLAGIAFLFFLTLMVIVLKWFDIRKLSEERFSNISINHKTPCSKCRYFNNNLYLKCAVQPEKVMTKEAKDCQDYCLQDRSS